MSSTDPAPTPVDIKPRSRDVTDGPPKAAGPGDAAGGRADRRRLGQAADRHRQLVERDHALQHDAAHARRARQARASARPAAWPLEFGTITVSDGISMGHEGMRASLVSREVICDSVETVVFAERLDGFVGMAGCDKSHAGDADGGGPPRPAEHPRLQRLDHARRARTAGRSTSRACSRPSAPTPPARSPTTSCGEIERHACPGEGACGGMFTANTMSSIGEAIGMSLPGSASPPAIDARRHGDARRRRRGRRATCSSSASRRAMIMTKQAFENAIALTSAARRLDQRRAAPARHRQRGRRRRSTSTTSTASPPGCRTSPT